MDLRTRREQLYRLNPRQRSEGEADRYTPSHCKLPRTEEEVEPIFHDELQPKNGRVGAPDKPGLGVTVNEKIFNG